MNETAESHYVGLAAAFVRGRLGGLADVQDEEVFDAGRRAGLSLHAFKRTATLPRVQRVLGMLRGLTPATLVDVGSGRGVFLWPLLDAFPELPVLAVDRDPRHVRDIETAHRGGLERLSAAHMDAECLALADNLADGVTLLEVLEHLARPERAVAEAVRVARRFVVASVPSKPDDNPGHIHLFDRARLERMLGDAGLRRVKVEYVLNHAVALGQV